MGRLEKPRMIPEILDGRQVGRTDGGFPGF